MLSIKKKKTKNPKNQTTKAQEEKIFLIKRNVSAYAYTDIHITAFWLGHSGNMLGC